MNKFISTAMFLLACSAICLIVAIERYQSAVFTAKAVAAQLDGVEFESVGIPLISAVMGFVSVVFCVAGMRLLFEHRRAENQPKGMLPDSSKP
jgi:uncharacterized membrane protein